MQAFSLLELLSVIAIISLLMAVLVAPASGILASTGRKGAVIIVMNTLEQARTAALETGRDVIVLLWKRTGDEPDSLLVLRKNENGTDWDQIGRWIKLPKGVIFHGGDTASEILNASPVPSLLDPAKLPGNPNSSELGGVQFSASGAVQAPKNALGLRVALTEGIRGPQGTEALLSAKKQAQSGTGSGFEVISIARYTGRTTLDITSL
jgi:prepilin-type N-terminal cleavage/methylation domain-containing protein